MSIVINTINDRKTVSICTLVLREESDGWFTASSTRVGNFSVVPHYGVKPGFHAGISTSASASTRIKNFPFSCACAYACFRAATNENEIPLRHNTSTRIFTKRG